MRSILVCFLISVYFVLPIRAENYNARDVIKKMDELYRSKTSFSTLRMDIATPHWKRSLEMDMWTKGMDHTFIRILSPRKERNVATLRIKNEMWNFLPTANKVIKIPPSMMMSSWMGSDFTNDDLVKESSMIEDYSFSFVNVENPNPELLYIKLVPKEDTAIVWNKIVIAIRKKDYLPVWEKFYDEDGELMRIMNFKDIKKFKNREIPAIMEIIPQNKKDNKTVITYIDAEFDIPLKDDVFTQRNLRSKE
ncbi:outer membrane lipoprotein-sorting protein [Elusimicrobiota bacterium]